MSPRERSRGGQRRRAGALLPLALLLLCTAFQTTARADTITLTGGQIVVDSTLRVISVSLTGAGFSLNSRVDDFPISPLSNTYITSTVGCGCDGFGLVSFGGLTVSGFVGSGSFTTTTVTGSINLLGNFDGTLGQPPFPITVNYTGTGVLSSSPTRAVFTITPAAAVPEPATLLLLGTGLAGVMAAARRRRGAGRGARGG